MNDSCILLTAFGDRRKNLEGCIRSIRRHLNCPIFIYTDDPINNNLEFNTDVDPHYKTKSVDTRWKDHPRYAYRNSDYWRIKALFDLPAQYQYVMYLDDDLRIVSPHIQEWDELARLFEFCMPMSVRSFTGPGTRGRVDSPTKTFPMESMTLCVSCMYLADRHSERFYTYWLNYLNQFDFRPGRAPVLYAYASYQTRIFPYVLAEQWSVFGLSATVIAGPKRPDPIIIHWSDKEVQRIWPNANV